MEELASLVKLQLRRRTWVARVEEWAAFGLTVVGSSVAPFWESCLCLPEALFLTGASLIY
jgi:hypothetical protein